MSKAITFNDLFTEYAETIGCTKSAAKAIIKKVFSVVSKELNDGNNVSIPDFGKFECKTRLARKGRNPKTGEEIDLPEFHTVSFKPSRYLKGSLN